MTFWKIITTTLLVAGLFKWPAFAWAEQIGTIRVTNLRMRSGPGKDYRIISLLPKGARVSVLVSHNDWLKIEHNGIKGFILHKARFIDIIVLNSSKQESGTGKLKNSEPDAETIKEQLRRVRSQLAAISREEKAILEAFNAADEALNSARRQVRLAETGLAKLNQEIDAVQLRAAALEKEILVQEQYAAKRLVALYKLNWVGKIQLLATADSFFDFINRKAALEKILSQDEALLETLNRNEIALASLLTQLNTRKAEKRALEISLWQQITKLSAQQKKRKHLLDTIGSKKSLGLAAVDALCQAAMELNATIERFEPATAHGTQANVPGKKGKFFTAYKGLLSWPVKGKIISFFGPYRDKKFGITNFQSGINIKTERGEPIRSVLNGHVIFAKWFKGFGNMMIVDHGNHYYTVYAHLEEVFKVKGDRVDRGEVIATVGDSGSLKGPALHFEVRHHGKPVDPLEWIKKG